MRVNGSTLIVGFALLAGAAGGGWWVLDRIGPHGAPPGFVAASGRAEDREIKVASTAGGRILRLAVEEGDSVDEGAEIAVLDSRIAAAAVASAQAAFEAARAGAQAAGRRVAALEGRLDLARLEAERYRRLFEHDAAPLQAAQQAESAYAQLNAETQAAQSAADMASRQADAARAQLDGARTQLGELTVHATARGIVRTVYLRSGEIAAPGAPIVAIGRVGDARLVVYVPLDGAERVTPGATVRVYPAAGAGQDPDRHLEGRVAIVAEEAEFTPRDVHMPHERSTLVFRVEIDVPDPASELKPGFPADAWIRTDPTAAWPSSGPW